MFHHAITGGQLNSLTFQRETSIIAVVRSARGVVDGQVWVVIVQAAGRAAEHMQGMVMQWCT